MTEILMIQNILSNIKVITFQQFWKSNRGNELRFFIVYIFGNEHVVRHKVRFNNLQAAVL